MKVLGYSPEPQVGRPRQAVWLGVRVGKTGRFRQGFIVQKSFGHSHKTKQNKMPAALSYLLARRGTGKGPKTGCLQLPSQQSHLRGPEVKELTGWLQAGPGQGSPRPLKLALVSTCCHPNLPWWPLMLLAREAT